MSDLAVLKEALTYGMLGQGTTRDLITRLEAAEYLIEAVGLLLDAIEDGNNFGQVGVYILDEARKVDPLHTTYRKEYKDGITSDTN